MVVTWRYFCEQSQRYFDSSSEIETYLEANPSHRIVEFAVSSGSLSSEPEIPTDTKLYIKDNNVVTELQTISGNLAVNGSKLATEDYVLTQEVAAPIYTVTGSISPNQQAVFSGIPMERYLKSFYIDYLNYENLALSWTPHDPSNFSTNEARLNDQNTAALVYNNSMPNTSGVWFAYDSGSEDTVINKFVVWDWNTAYVATSFAFESSNDAEFNSILYTEIFSNTATTGEKVYYPAEEVQGRYFRIRSINQVNFTYWVIAEFELYYLEMGTEFQLATDSNLSVTSSGSDSIVITGLDVPPDTTVKVAYL